MRELKADEKGDAKNCQSPAAAEVTMTIDEEVMSFHERKGILTLCVRSPTVREGYPPYSIAAMFEVARPYGC